MLTRLTDLLDRLESYPIWEVLAELIVIWLVVYAIVRFLRGTRAVGALKGMFMVLLIGTLVTRILGGGGDTFSRLTYLYDRAIAFAAIALIVIFQPELRRGLMRLGEAPLFRTARNQKSYVVESVASACEYLAKARFGAIIVIERHVGLRGLTEGGTPLDAELSDRLLRTIFFPGSALHDLAVVIRGGRVAAAGVQLPLAEPNEMPDAQLGSRHRAAVGVSKETDSIVVVVSEESGQIRIAERGILSPPIAAATLAADLTTRLGRTPQIIEHSHDQHADDVTPPASSAPVARSPRRKEAEA